MIEQYRNQEARNLSHGHLRILEIAVAVLRGPKVLLLDEPAAELSFSEVDQLAGLVRALASKGLGIILVEHHLEFVEDVSDEIQLLRLGRRMWSGPPAELRGNSEVQAAYLGDRMSPSLLEVENLSVSYAGVKAVHGISFSVGKAECVALVGPNGAGKTSVLRAIGGLTGTDRRTHIRLSGSSIDRLSAERRARLGIGHVLEGGTSSSGSRCTRT